MIYEASHLKRSRATKVEIEDRRQKLYKIVRAMRPMTVRQVFYQATVRGIIEKTELGYDKVQKDLVAMRRGGELRYDWLADNTRWQRRPQTYNDGVPELSDFCPVYGQSRNPTLLLSGVS
jgi:hypothetical protein